MNNAVFWKTLENVNYIEILERRRHCLVSEPNYHTTKFFTKTLLKKIYLKKMKKTLILMNKSVHLGLSILELSKILMY